MKKMPLLRGCFFLEQDKPVPRYLPLRSGSLRNQYYWWRTKGIKYAANKSEVLLFFPVGRFYELYNDQALSVQKSLGLRLNKWQRGFRVGCGFHRCLLGRYLIRALELGYHVALLTQERRPDGRVQRRLVKLFKAESVPALAEKPQSIQRLSL